MSTGTGRQQNRLLPYLLAILVVLLAYTVYTRVLRPARPPAAVVATPPPPVAATPAQPGPTPAAAPSPAASPATGSPGPGPAVVPARPSGRSNPFAALVTEQVARPTPPPAPPVPPPFFPGTSTGPGGPAPSAAGTPGFRAVGVLLQDGSAIGIVELGKKTYIVREGDVVEGVRVERIEDGQITLRRGDARVELRLGGGAQP